MGGGLEPKRGKKRGGGKGARPKTYNPKTVQNEFDDNLSIPLVKVGIQKPPNRKNKALHQALGRAAVKLSSGTEFHYITC